MDKCPVCELMMNDIVRHMQFAHQEEVVLILGEEDGPTDRKLSSL